ncbi:MAG: 50S ribosomal protein L10 [Methanosarcinales archaeon]|nr:MAG: 50S ribosomal protein L10 [Methanosarcinales archaeon]
MLTEHRTAHIPQWKLDEIENIKQLVGKYPVMGIVGIRDIPAKQLQEMRRSLKGVAKFHLYRNSLLRRAFDQCDDTVGAMEEHINDQTALIFTDLNPFKLFKLLEASKTSAPIKAGALAPEDIVVKAGPTSFAPGPVIGDLQNAGIPAKIDKGKVMIRTTTVVAHAGEPVSRELSKMLTRLEIYPMTVGLDLRAVYDAGTVLESGVLDINEAEYTDNLAIAATRAFNLAIGITYPSNATILTLLSQASAGARNLGINSAIPVPGLVDTLLQVAQSKATSLACNIDDPAALGDALQALLPAQAAVEETAPVAEATEETAEDASGGDSQEAAEEESAEEKEEEAAEGLGLLFG